MPLAQDVYIAQKANFHTVYGRDDANNRDPDMLDAPVTPIAHAIKVLDYWTSHVRTLSEAWEIELARQASADPDKSGIDLVGFAHMSKSQVLEIGRQLDRAARAIQRGFLVGRTWWFPLITIFPQQDAQIFWDSLRRIASEIQSLGMEVSAYEKFEAFVEGAEEGLDQVADAAGRAAAKVARKLGETAGGLLGGFFDELGVKELLVLAGGAYVLTRPGVL